MPFSCSKPFGNPEKKRSQLSKTRKRFFGPEATGQRDRIECPVFARVATCKPEPIMLYRPKMISRYCEGLFLRIPFCYANAFRKETHHGVSRKALSL